MIRERRLQHGFTLVELLVVITIIGVLIGLLLPAIQAVRESARRTSCSNNLKQLMLAFHGHLSNTGAFPPARISTSGRQHGWIVDLLPYMEEKGLSSAYRPDKNFFAAENEAVGRTAVMTAICPSAPGSLSQRLQPIYTSGGAPANNSGITADYSVAYLLNMNSANMSGAYCSPNCVSYENLKPVLYAGPDEDNKPHPTTKVTDGLAHSVLICEQAGRPDHFVLGRKQDDNKALLYPNWWMAWASFRNFTYQGYDDSGLNVGASYSINCNNSQGIYSFHLGGANTTFCDGSVQFISQEIPVGLMFALLTRSGDEPIDAAARYY